MVEPIAVETARAREITDVAAGLFRKAGYRETSIRDLAAAVDIRSASLYYHFGKKEDILFAIAHQLMLDFLEDVTPVLDTEDPERAVRAVVGAHLRFEFSRLDHVIVSARERRLLPVERQRPINALRARHRDALAETIARGATRGVFVTDVPQLAAHAVLDLLNGVKEWYHPPRDGSLDRLVERYEHHVLALLGHPSASR
jgi:AcrR family transcriptional regulator